MCIRDREDRRETAKRKTKKEDAGPTYGARGKEDQLRGIQERSTEPGRMVPSSLKPALGQSTQRRRDIKLTVLYEVTENKECHVTLFTCFCFIVLIYRFQVASSAYRR